MLLGVALLLCLVSVPIAGGRLSVLGNLQFRGTGLAFSALAIQVLVITLAPGGSPVLHRVLHLLSYVVIAVFLVANRRIPYLWLMGSGGALNAIAIFANGGVMPARAAALETAGIRQDDALFTNSTSLPHPHLLPLGDVFAIPAWFPVSNVFSVGDVLIVAGAFLALHRICGSRLPRRLAPARPAV